MKKIFLAVMALGLLYGASALAATTESVKSIKLQAKGQELYWLVDGKASQGFKVLWSKNANPIYPTRTGDNGHYLESASARYDKIEATDGQGIYYVRVCEFLGDRCGLYSNQVMVELGAATDSEDKPYCVGEGGIINLKSDVKCCSGLTTKAVETGSALRSICYKADKGEPACKNNVWYYSNGSILRKGDCPKEQLYCTMDYNPVCGSDNKTYGNECTAKAAGITTFTKGECSGAVACTMDYNPVCGSDNKTYGNECTAKAAGIKTFTKGECVAVDLTNCLSYYDGCNDCSVKDGKIVGCTKRACVRHDTPKCLEYVVAKTEVDVTAMREELTKLQTKVANQEKEIKQLKETLTKLTKQLEENTKTIKKLRTK